MTDKEKKILFEALNEILTNQSKMMKHNGTVSSNDDLYCKSQYINVQKTENNNVQISATLPTEFLEKFAFPGVCMTDLLLK